MTKKYMEDKLHRNQDKENAYIGVNDKVKITIKKNKKRNLEETIISEGKIIEISIRKEKDKLHPIIDLESPDGSQKCFWIEQIDLLEIIEFK